MIQDLIFYINEVNKFYNIKLKAGALQYTIFIAVVIALLIFAFISLTFVQQRLSAKNKHFQHLIEKVDQAFLETDLRELAYTIPTVLTSHSEERNELSGRKRPWGIFDVVHIKGTRGKEIVGKTALVANQQLKRPALYIQDENQPLVLVGETRIEGDVYLPEQGVKRGTIAGNSYTNTQLIYGAKAKSKNRLPSLLNLETLKKMKIEIFSDNSIDAKTLEDDMVLVNSFSQPTIMLVSMPTLDIRGVRLTGNIIVYATKKLKVHASSLLTDVILMAPEIEIGENVKGNFQAIASKKIHIAKNCSLSYPSSLILLEDPQTSRRLTDKTTQIVIENGSDMKGIIAFISSNAKESYDTHIRINENVSITGEVYCNQNIELKGRVHGSVYTRGFVANQFGSVYKNHIYNGKISSNALPNQYVGLQFENTRQKPAKWLYY